MTYSIAVVHQKRYTSSVLQLYACNSAATIGFEMIQLSELKPVTIHRPENVLLHQVNL